MVHDLTAALFLKNVTMLDVIKKNSFDCIIKNLMILLMYNIKVMLASLKVEVAISSSSELLHILLW